MYANCLKYLFYDFLIGNERATLKKQVKPPRITSWSIKVQQFIAVVVNVKIERIWNVHLHTCLCLSYVGWTHGRLQHGCIRDHIGLW